MKLSISTHAPREGSDVIKHWRIHNYIQISTHAPREGSDHAGRIFR